MATKTRRRALPAREPSQRQMETALAALLAARAELEQADPDIKNDPVLYADMLEGQAEGDPLAVLDSVVRAAIDAEAMAEMARSRCADMQNRVQKFARRHERLKRAAFTALQLLELPKVEREDFMIRLQLGRGKVVVPNVEELPEDCIRITREPDKIEIGRRLELNQPVRGAYLSNAEPYLVIQAR